MGLTFNPFTGTFDFAGGGSSATIAGTIAATQVAFGTALDTIGGSAGLTYVGDALLLGAQAAGITGTTAGSLYGGNSAFDYADGAPSWVFGQTVTPVADTISSLGRLYVYFVDNPSVDTYGPSTAQFDVSIGGGHGFQAINVINSTLAVHDSGTHVDSWGRQVYLASYFDKGTTTNTFSSIWIQAPGLSFGSGAAPVIGSFFGTYAEAMGGTSANTYPLWFDEQGVFRIKADNTFNSVYQAIPTLYNPQFTKYTPGAANYERLILAQWNGNVGEIAMEAGGTGTLRDLRLVAGTALYVQTEGGAAYLPVHASDFIVHGSAFKSDTTTAHTALFQAYDVDGATYSTFATLTNGNTPSFVITPPTGGTVTVNATTLQQAGNTLTLGGALTTSGAFASTFTMTAATGVTFPTTGTLLTTAGSGTSLTFPGLLSIASTKTLTASNTLTLTGTDGITVAFGGGLSVATAKVFTASNTLTLTGTDSTSFAFPSSSDTVVTLAATQTLTNKRITKRITTASDATSITPNSDTADITYQLNTQAVAGTLTINADGGTPTNGQGWVLKVKSTNAQTFAWNAIYVGGAVPLPTQTSGSSKIDYFAFVYDTVTPKWDYTGPALGY